MLRSACCFCLFIINFNRKFKLFSAYSSTANENRKYFMPSLLYISCGYGMISMVALYPSQSVPISKKGLKILLRAYR